MRARGEDALEIVVPLAIAAQDIDVAALMAARPEAFARDEAGEARLVSEGWRSTKQKRWTDLGARLPDTADGTLDVGVSQFERLRLQITLAGANASKATLDRGRVVYPEVFVDVDRVFGSDANRLEELLVLRSANAPHEFVWRVELPADIVDVIASPEGIEFRGVNGYAELRMPWPYALDGRGKKRDVRFEWNKDAHELRASIDRDGLVYPVVIDPRFETGVWYAPAIFSYRQSHATAFDTARGNLVLFGGGTSSGGLSSAFGDTWIWNGSTWTQVFPAISPTPRFGHAMAFDSVRNVVVLFGGYGGATRYDDTWTWDGTTWTKMTTAVSPPGRSSHAMAFDAVRGNMVLFGGDNGTKLRDTWTWNGSAWAQVVGAMPPGRSSHAMTFDATRNNVVLFGGAGASANLNDTWIWNGTAWTQPTLATNPPARANHSIAYDGARADVVLFGGMSPGSNDCWIWNGTAWSQRATALPLARQGFSMSYDSIRQRVVVAAGYSLAAGGGSFRDTWLWNGTAWAQNAPPPTPSIRYLHAMAFDAARGNVVLFGGFGNSTYLGDTWIWDGTTWTLRAPVFSPPGMLLSAMAYDAVRGNVVLFGGTSGAPRNQTYAWSGTNWILLSPPTVPPARSGHLMEYDAERQNIVMFGGSAASGYLGDTWTWNGSDWTATAPAQSPPARDLSAIAYDSVRKVVVLFGGRSATSPGLDDTWTWNGTTWTDVPSTLSPSRRAIHAMAFDSRRGSLVLFGGLDQGGATLGDTWFWNGSSWASGTTTQPPPSRIGGRMAFDAVRGSTVLFGGNNASNAGLNDTWLLYPLGSSCSQDSDCPSAACVDGVCCNAAACGTCETCAGTSPGRCAPVQNEEDADSCPASANKSCSPVGECKLALGAPANGAVECASGFVVDGVCCDSRCDSLCQACRADLKESQQRSGVCDHARTGLDPHDTCSADDASSCNQDGTCDGRGKCRLFTSGTGCGDVACIDNRATGRLCNGFGSCGESAAGVACGLYACLDAKGCQATCSSDAECNVRSHCEESRCVANEGASCDGDHTVTSPEGTTQDCGKYKCEGAVCKTRCVGIRDCVSPAECTPEGLCIDFVERIPGDGGGCGMHGSRERLVPVMTTAFLALAFAFRSKRRSRAEKA